MTDWQPYWADVLMDEGYQVCQCEAPYHNNKLMDKDYYSPWEDCCVDCGEKDSVAARPSGEAGTADC